MLCYLYILAYLAEEYSEMRKEKWKYGAYLTTEAYRNGTQK